VKVDNVELHPTATALPEDGRYRVVSPTTLVIQLPSATLAGRHRLGVQLDPEQPEALFTLDVPL